MKYGVVWKNTVANMPPQLKDACLNYKKFKKLSKDTHTSATIIKGVLDGDLFHAAYIFRDQMTVLKKQQQRHHPAPAPIFRIIPIPPCMRACPSIETSSYAPDALTPQQLYEFATFNTTTLYKICKRLDKRQHISTFTRWYRKAVNDKAIPFVNRNVQALLALHAHNMTATVTECPICFEDPTQNGIILDCGHIICTGCIMSMLHVQHMKGTISNLISYGSYMHPHNAKCPLCRDPKALTKYQLIVKGQVQL